MRYDQYAMKHEDRDVGIVIPNKIRKEYKSVLGWCTKGVDSLADRLVFRNFANDKFNVNSIFAMNNPDVYFDSAVLSALIASCSFTYISKDEDGKVRLQVIKAGNATGNINPITGLLNEGYAVLDRDDNGIATLEAHFLPDRTDFYYDGGKRNDTIPHVAGIPLLVPIIHRPDADRVFGRSRISRAGMYWQKNGKQTLERAGVTAEFYSFPQKYVTGLDPEAEPMESWKATVSSMLVFAGDGDGNKPTLGQFTSPSMSPFTEQLRMAAAGFAGENDLTLDDLGFVSDNPSSVEAIKASHENLRLAGRKAQRSLGSGLLNVAYVAACLRDDFAYSRAEFSQTIPKWEPLFEPDASTFGMIGDGVFKLNTAMPDYITKEMLDDMTGLKGEANG